MATVEKKHTEPKNKLNIFRFREQSIKHMRDTTLDDAKEQFLMSVTYFNNLEAEVPLLHKIDEE